MDKHFIVLNGKRYDAVTGKLLGEHAQISTTPTPVKRTPTRATHVAAKKVHAPRTHVARVTRPSHAPVHVAPTPVAVQHVKPVSARPHHSVPHHATHSKVQSPKTLMRRVVHKPEPKGLQVLKVQYPVAKAGSPVKVMAPKRLAHQVDDVRLSRAKQIKQSQHVGRFQPAALAPVVPKQLPKQPEQHRVPVSVTAAAPVKRSPQKPVAKRSIFEEALAEARSHEETYGKKRSSKRMLGAVTSVAALFIITGVVVIANSARLETQLASVQAGFSVATPAHVPAGFVKNDTAVAGKSVALKYVSGVDKSSYTLSQESSNWNSQTLFDHIYAQHGTAYQAIQHNGQTIYVFGESEAAWVTGGVLYQIEGDADLTTDDILAIADSV